MNISLTPELENIIRAKVKTGLYNNASEVIREALRFQEENEELAKQMKLEWLRAKLRRSDEQFERGEYTQINNDQEMSEFFDGIKRENS